MFFQEKRSKFFSERLLLSKKKMLRGIGVRLMLIVSHSLGVMFLLLAVICVVFYLNKKSVIKSK